MLNSILLEVEGEWTCPDEPPKGPGTPVPPKKANPIEIKRVIVSIGTRRKNLVAARAKLQSAQHSGEPVAIACEKMRVKAAEGWLAFTNKRYELLRDLQKAKGSKTAEVASLLAWGDQQLARSQKHQAAGLDEPVPPIPDVTFDYKSNKMLGSDGKEFSVPEIDAVDAEIAMLPSYAPALEPFTLTPEPPAPAPSPTPEPPPPEPEPPKELTTLSPEHEEEIVAGLKKRLIAHAVTGYPVLEGSDVKEIAATVLGSDIPPPSDALQGSLAQQAYAAIVPMQTDPTPDELASIGMFADALVDTVPIVDGVPQFDKFKLGYQLRDNTAHTIGKILKVGSSQDIIEAAIEKLKKKPKPWHMFSMADQENIKAIVKKTAIWAASEHMDLMEAVPVIGGKLVSQGYYMAAAPLGSIVASYWGEYTHKNWEELSPEKQDALKGVAKSAQAIGANIFDAVKNAGIVHLSADGLAKLADEIDPKKQPDSAGFLAAVDAALGANAHHPVDLLTFGDVVDTLQTSGKPLDDLMAEFHIKDAGGLQADMMKLAHAHLKGLVGSLAGLQNTVVTRWDVTAASGMAPDKTSFVDYAASALSTDGVSSAAFDTAFSQSRYAWLEGVYDEWHRKWAEKTTPAPNAPVAGATPAPAPTPPSPVAKPYLGYTKKSKISKATHLTLTQENYLAAKINAAIASGAHLTSTGVVGPKKIAAAVKKIHAEFKSDWEPSGVTQIGLGLIKSQFDAALAAPPPPSPPTPTEAANSAAAAAPSPAANAPEDHMALFEAGKHVLTSDKEKFDFPDIWKKTVGVGKPFVSNAQKSYYNALLAKLKKAVPIAPGVPAQAATPVQAAQVQPKAPTAQSPIGMSYEEIKNYTQLTKPPMAPDKPETGWIGGRSFGVGGAHPKKLVGTDADFVPTGLTFKTPTKATHAWMIKSPLRAGVGAVEVAANRIQGLLGLPTTAVAWAEGNDVVQHFETRSNFENTPEPWKNHPYADHIARQLQKHAVFGYLIAELDDHPGNFVISPDGTLTGVDKGQAFRFFDSSQSMMDHLDSTQHNATGGRLPKKMLQAWMGGQAVPLMPLTDPEFEDFISRAEAIPSDLYKDMLKKYAVPAKGEGKLAAESSVAADKTVAGFLDGVDTRRTGIRASVGEFYAGLAKTRAQSLKNMGDARPLSEIESEIRDQLGIDEFLQGKTPAVKANASIPSLAKALADDEAVGWDESKLPKTSHIPDDAIRKELGFVGSDMMVGGADVKDGRVQFFRLGDNDFQTFILDTKARAALEARLPGATLATSGPTEPSPPFQAPFTPPPKPDFDEKDTRGLWREVLGAAGNTENAKHTSATDIAKVGDAVTKIEKHLKRWRDGKGDPNSQYVGKGYDKAKVLSNSADPLEKAAGEWYKAEFERVGAVSDAGVYALKDVAIVPEDERQIRPFVPTPDLIAAQKKAKADGEVAYDAAVAAAKKTWDDEKAKLDAAHQTALDAYAGEKAKFDEEVKAAGVLPAIKHDHYPVPAGVVTEAYHGGANKVSKASAWGGAYGKPWDDAENSMETYEIDFTDVVTAVAGAGGTGKKRLLVHYAPSTTTTKTDRYGSSVPQARRHPARGGTVRIQYPAGATKEQISAYTKAIYAALGMKDTRPATAADQELGYLRRMAWLARLEGYKVSSVKITDEPQGSVAEKIEWWVEKFKASAYGHDPRIKKGTTKTPNPDYQPEAINDDGRLSYNNFMISEEDVEKWRANDIRFAHNVADSDLGETLINGGNLIATEKRAHIGLMPKKAAAAQASAATGKSSKADVRTGGANEVYFVLGKGASRTIDLDASIMRRTSVWGYSGDNWGAKVDYGDAGNPTHRLHAHENFVVEMVIVEMAKKALADVTLEDVFIGDKINFLKWTVGLKASGLGMTKDQLVKKLKDAGVGLVPGSDPPEYKIGPRGLTPEELVH